MKISHKIEGSKVSLMFESDKSNSLWKKIQVFDIFDRMEYIQDSISQWFDNQFLGVPETGRLIEAKHLQEYTMTKLLPDIRRVLFERYEYFIHLQEGYLGRGDGFRG